MARLSMLVTLLIATQSSAQTLSVEGLGEVAVPVGEWSIELVHRSPETKETPDVFVLRRAGDTIERLTILRYPREIKMRAYVYCDSTADSVLFGIPAFLECEYNLIRERKGEIKLTPKENGSVEMVRRPTDFDAKRLELTNVYTDSNDVNWMNNACISETEECVFVIVHTAPRVLLPETLLNCCLRSKLLPPP